MNRITSNTDLLIFVVASLLLIVAIFIAMIHAGVTASNDAEIEADIQAKEKLLLQVDKKLDDRTKARTAKLIDTLDWLKERGIIDDETHRYLLSKSLPFI